jgi:hypothetical protein
MGHVAHVGLMRNAHRIFVGRAEWKIRLERIRFRWETNIKIDLKEVDRQEVHWIKLA